MADVPAAMALPRRDEAAFAQLSAAKGSHLCRVGGPSQAKSMTSRGDLKLRCCQPSCWRPTKKPTAFPDGAHSSHVHMTVEQSRGCELVPNIGNKGATAPRRLESDFREQGPVWSCDHLVDEAGTAIYGLMGEHHVDLSPPAARAASSKLGSSLLHQSLP